MKIPLSYGHQSKIFKKSMCSLKKKQSKMYHQDKFTCGIFMMTILELYEINISEFLDTEFSFCGFLKRLTKEFI